MRTWIFSDSHNRHGFLDVPDGIDLAVFAGDASIAKSPYMNSNQVLDFLEWYDSLYIKNKIFVPGNHDTSVEAGLVNTFKSVRPLVHKEIEIDGKRIFGSPYTPEFGYGWAYNVPRGDLYKFWKDIPDKLDLLVTHGPPKGVMDLTQYDSRSGANGKSFFQCGCVELLDAVQKRRPRFHAFGHIHQEEFCRNPGILKLNDPKFETTFINAAVVDLNYNIHNNGIIIDL